MGQSSIPVLNRSGYSMFWNSVWENKHNYTTFFKEDVLIRKYITFLFNEKISSQTFFLKNLNLNIEKKAHWQKVYNIKLDLNQQSLINFLNKFNKLPLYISKIHIIRLDNWIILYFVGSTPTTLKKFDIVNNGKIFSSTSFFFRKYLIDDFKKSFFF